MRDSDQNDAILCRNNGRMDKGKVRAIMERAAEPAALSGSEIWCERAHDSRVKRYMGTAKRKLQLASVRCYRTVATNTLRVINGTPPWHLVAAAAFRFRELSGRKRIESTLVQKLRKN